jgi:hypothetical protein
MKAKLFVIVAAGFLLARPAFAQNRVITTSGHTVTTDRRAFNSNYSYPGWRGCSGWRGGWGWGPSVSIGIGFPFYSGGYGYPYGGYYGSYYSGGSAPYYASQPGESRGNSGGSVVSRVQERLARGGYYAGSVDGVIGPRTRSAIRAYERHHGLPVDGEIDRDLLATMGLA